MALATCTNRFEFFDLSSNGKGPNAATPPLDFLKLTKKDLSSTGKAQQAVCTQPQGSKARVAMQNDVQGLSEHEGRNCRQFSHMHQQKCIGSFHLLFSVTPPRPERRISRSRKNVLTRAQGLQPLTKFKHPDTFMQLLSRHKRILFGPEWKKSRQQHHISKQR